MVNVLEDMVRIQKDKFENWHIDNKMNFSKDKCKVILLGGKTSKCTHTKYGTTSLAAALLRKMWKLN